jgi:lysozyme
MTDYIQGIDISRAQGRNVDHQAVADSGMRFCLCKATEGRDYEDERFEENIQKIRAVTGQVYYPGAYHFARPDSVGGRADGKAEAEDFCDVIERVCGDITHDFMPPALDFEKYSESDAKNNIPWIEAWIETVERRLKRRPMIYTGYKVWGYEVGNTAIFKDYPLWLVYYSGAAVPKTPMGSLPWDQWSMWQYSGGKKFQHHPKVPGVGVVDVNRFAGTLDDLKKFANLPADPSPKSGAVFSPLYFDLSQLSEGEHEEVRRLQAMLSVRGYDISAITDEMLDAHGYVLAHGVVDEATTHALMNFKKKYGLPATPVVDPATWLMLIIGK